MNLKKLGILTIILPLVSSCSRQSFPPTATALMHLSSQKSASHRPKKIVQVKGLLARSIARIPGLRSRPSQGLCVCLIDFVLSQPSSPRDEMYCVYRALIHWMGLSCPGWLLLLDPKIAYSVNSKPYCDNTKDPARKANSEYPTNHKKEKQKHQIPCKKIDDEQSESSMTMDAHTQTPSASNQLPTHVPLRQLPPS